VACGEAGEALWDAEQDLRSKTVAPPLSALKPALAIPYEKY